MSIFKKNIYISRFPFFKISKDIFMKQDDLTISVLNDFYSNNIHERDQAHQILYFFHTQEPAKLIIKLTEMLSLILQNTDDSTPIIFSQIITNIMAPLNKATLAVRMDDDEKQAKCIPDVSYILKLKEILISSFNISNILYKEHIASSLGIIHVLLSYLNGDDDMITIVLNIVSRSLEDNNDILSSVSLLTLINILESLLYHSEINFDRTPIYHVFLQYICSDRIKLEYKKLLFKAMISLVKNFYNFYDDEAASISENLLSIISSNNLIDNVEFKELCYDLFTEVYINNGEWLSIDIYNKCIADLANDSCLCKLNILLFITEILNNSTEEIIETFIQGSCLISLLITLMINNFEDNFYDKEWNIYSSSLDCLEKLLLVENAANRLFDSIIDLIKSVYKDNNVACISVAIECYICLVNGISSNIFHDRNSAFLLLPFEDLLCSTSSEVVIYNLIRYFTALSSKIDLKSDTENLPCYKLVMHVFSHVLNFLDNQSDYLRDASSQFYISIIKFLDDQTVKEHFNQMISKRTSEGLRISFQIWEECKHLDQILATDESFPSLLLSFLDCENELILENAVCIIEKLLSLTNNTNFAAICYEKSKEIFEKFHIPDSFSLLARSATVNNNYFEDFIQILFDNIVEDQETTLLNVIVYVIMDLKNLQISEDLCSKLVSELLRISNSKLVDMSTRSACFDSISTLIYRKVGNSNVFYCQPYYPNIVNLCHSIIDRYEEILDKYGEVILNELFTNVASLIQIFLIFNDPTLDVFNLAIHIILRVCSNSFFENITLKQNILLIIITIIKIAPDHEFTPQVFATNEHFIEFINTCTNDNDQEIKINSTQIKSLLNLH